MRSLERIGGHLELTRIFAGVEFYVGFIRRHFGGNGMFGCIFLSLRFIDLTGLIFTPFFHSRVNKCSSYWGKKLILVIVF